MRPALNDIASLIDRALAAEGGHLAIGRGGYTLHYARGCTVSGYDAEPMKAACLAAEVPIIDSRMVPIDIIVELLTRGPLVAVGEPADPQPWHALASAPLDYVAELYRAAGAEVANMPARTVQA